MKEMAYSSDPNADREILDEGYVHGYWFGLSWLAASISISRNSSASMRSMMILSSMMIPFSPYAR